MTVIKQEDLIESVADALQYISYYHPAVYIQHLARAYEAEQSPAAQILRNLGFTSDELHETVKAEIAERSA